MKRHWTEDELETDWRILPNEKTLIKSKQGATRLGFAVLLMQGSKAWSRNYWMITRS